MSFLSSGCVEWSNVLRDQEVQGTEGQTEDRVWRPHTDRAPQHSQVSQVSNEKSDEWLKRKINNCCFRYWTDDGKTDDKTRETSKPRASLIIIIDVLLDGLLDHCCHSIQVSVVFCGYIDPSNHHDYASGNPDHRVHELWFSEAVPEEDQEECSQDSTSILEAVVHSDSLSAIIFAQVEYQWKFLPK